jgi:hypothetical protein
VQLLSRPDIKPPSEIFFNVSEKMRETVLISAEIFLGPFDKILNVFRISNNKINISLK